ncbi:MAG: glutamate racemase [Candidatus Dadabacteria bacterium]|nr:glutamate racemase [Candidatus Dadabacteria bacterium]
MTDSKSNSSPIGIFDSGIGGLTVVREIFRKLPGENIIYLGDTASVPYGTKSSETVIKYSQINSRFLVSKGIKLLVVACNTASAVSLTGLRWDLEIPVMGVIEPGARKGVRITKTGKVGVIGTPSTIKSGAYKKAMENMAPEIKVYSKACPLLVPLAEEGWTDGEIAQLTARRYLEPLKESGIDVLILGCTHYPLLKSTIQKVIGEDVALVDSAEETALEIERTLKENGISNEGSYSTQREFYLTDVSETFIAIAERFLGEKVERVEQVDI